jgi:DUF1009 family protein
MRKLGLIAGGGALPATLARHCASIGREIFILRLTGFADPSIGDLAGADVGLAQVGKGIRLLRQTGCTAVCFAGAVSRPNFRALKPDLRGLAALPGAIIAAGRGDDALLTFMVGEFEKEGFVVEGAHDVMGGLTLGPDLITRRRPSSNDMADATRALEVARVMGRLDVGQGAVCCQGLILAVEAQEGTDAMLRRVATLPSAVRGSPRTRRGVLAKASKPGQELRIDLPTIGPETVRNAAAAGLAGIVGEDGLVIVVDREEAVAIADALGLFLIGLPAQAG